MQKKKLLAITILTALLLCSALAVSTAQQTPLEAEQEENTLTGMAIGIGSAIFTVSLIGVLFFRKQN